MGSETDALLPDSLFAETYGLSVGDMLVTGDGAGQRQWMIKVSVTQNMFIMHRRA